jgi:diketogulonate reductase-like aldo/keto reductase
MTYETLPDGTRLPRVGLGTWAIGGRMEADRSRDGFWVELIAQALEVGYRHIDTAEMYAAGHTEELVGQAIRGRDREGLFITSKLWSSNLRRDRVRRAFEGSLRRLGTDYLDLYLIHWPNPEVPLGETFEALNDLAASGAARRLGVSNFSAEQTVEALSLCAAPLATNQVEYNLFRREAERDGVLELCRRQGILLTAYEPLGKGRVPTDRRLQELASSYGLTAGEAALAWVLSRSRVATVCMSSTPEHLEQNIRAADIELPAPLLRELDGLD